MLLLDTDVMIDFQREYAPCVAWITAQTQPLMLPGFVAFELLQDARNKDEQRESLVVVNKFDIVWPTADDMRLSLNVYTALHLANGIGICDALIAGTAVGYGVELVTFNVKHYRLYPNLRTLQPY